VNRALALKPLTSSQTQLTPTGVRARVAPAHPQQWCSATRRAPRARATRKRLAATLPRACAPTHTLPTARHATVARDPARAACAGVSRGMGVPMSCSFFCLARGSDAAPRQPRCARAPTQHTLNLDKALSPPVLPNRPRPLVFLAQRLTAPGVSPVPSPRPSPSPSPTPPPASPSPAPPGTRWVKQASLANWAGAPIAGKAGKVALKKVAVAEAPARCQAADQKANAAAFSIGATAKGAPKFCFLFASRPARQCDPADKKRLACALDGQGAFAREP
jgi:hypothetical protein